MAQSRHAPHDWAKELTMQFSIELDEGAFGLFDRQMFVDDCNGTILGFSDGVIRFAANGQKISVYASGRHNNASILVQATNTIVAECKLSHDHGLLIKHAKWPGNRIPEATQGRAVAMVLWPRYMTRTGVGRYPSATIVSAHSPQTGRITVTDSLNGPKLMATDRFCVMFAHHRYLQAQLEPAEPAATVEGVANPIEEQAEEQDEEQNQEQDHDRSSLSAAVEALANIQEWDQFYQQCRDEQ